MVTISNNLISAQTLALKSGGSIENLLKVGQTLTATIQPVNNKQVNLTIGNHSFLAATKQPITENGQIQVKVNQVKPDIQLAIIKPQPSATHTTQQTIQSAYRQFIPTQAPLSQVFQQMAVLPGLPTGLQTPIQQLLTLATRNTAGISGESIKQKLIESGLFLESKLRDKNASGNNIKQDIKAQILQLQQQVSSLQKSDASASLNKLSTLLNQALSKLTVQQVSLFENPNITPLELPFEQSNQIHKNYVELRKNQVNHITKWEAYVDITLPKGTLSSKIKLDESGVIECFLWCETPELEKEIDNNIGLLKSYFQQNNLEVANIYITHTKPTKTDSTTKIALIDIKI